MSDLKKIDLSDLFDYVPPGESNDYGVTCSPRCDECGRFAKASDLRMVYGPMPEGGPDHEACGACRAKRREALS